MKNIKLLKVIIRNFRSFTEETVTFPSEIGLRLLSGNNLLQPSLGANGAGKSSLFDAICWCITGTSIRGARTSSVISWGALTTEVETMWSINDVLTILHRFGPPMKVELNGEITTQEKVDQLLGLSKLRFLHSIIFGQGVPLFPDLPIPERGELLDEVLNLNIWQKATEAAGTKCSSFEKSLTKMKADLAYINGQLSSLQTEDEVEQEISKWEDDKQHQLSSLQESLDWWEEERDNQIIKIREQSSSWLTRQTEKIESLKELRDKWKEEKIAEAENKVKQIELIELELSPIVFERENFVDDPFRSITTALQKQVQEWEKVKAEQVAILHKAEYDLTNCVTAHDLWTKDTCPMCLQKISSDKKKHELQCIEKLKSSTKKKKEEAEQSILQLTSKIANFNKQIQENQSATARAQEKKKSFDKEIFRLRQQVAIVEKEAQLLIEQHEKDPYTRQIQSAEQETNPHDKQEQQLQQKENPYQSQICRVQKSANPFITKLDKLKRTRTELLAKQVIQETEYKQTEEKMIAAEYWKHGFKRIRLYFVQQVLAMLEVEIQSAISALGLNGWAVNLSTESVTRSETIKLGVQLIVKSPTNESQWESWSGGESQRLRLGIAMGLGSLIQRSAGVCYNIEVWDEPSRALSKEGIEDLVEALKYRAESARRCIFLVDHNALTYSGFSEVWTAIKTQQFGTKIEKTYSQEI